MTSEEIIEECVENALQSMRYSLKHQDFSESSEDYKMGWKVAMNVITHSLPDHVREKTKEWIKQRNKCNNIMCEQKESFKN